MVKLKSKRVPKRVILTRTQPIEPPKKEVPISAEGNPFDCSAIHERLSSIAEGLQWLENLCITTNSRVNEIGREWAVEQIKLKASIDHLADLILDAGIDTEGLAEDLKKQFVILGRD